MTMHDGDEEVRRYYHDTRVAFPDQHHEIIALRHSADAVMRGVLALRDAPRDALDDPRPPAASTARG